jgi:hypothetical protein
VNGQFFETAHGPHVVIAASSFLHFVHYAHDQDLTAVCEEQQALGFNEGRVFLGIKGGLGDFDPRPYLDKLPGFCTFTASKGQRIEFTFGDWKRWCPDPADQRRLLHDVEARILPYAAWARIEGMNEGDNKDNFAVGIVNETLDPAILWCLGSRIQDAGTMVPVKRYGTYHPSRTKDWPRKVGHNCMEVAAKHKIPCTSNETKRPDEDGFQASNFFDAAANASLLCAGACFHSQAGKTSTLFTDDERRCAEAWVAGATAVPLAYRYGSYTAGHLHDSPVEYRPGKWSHARILGNRACVSVPQNPDGWVTKNGWRLVKQTGTVMELERP